MVLWFDGIAAVVPSPDDIDGVLSDAGEDFVRSPEIRVDCPMTWVEWVWATSQKLEKRYWIL